MLIKLSQQSAIEARTQTNYFNQTILPQAQEIHVHAPSLQSTTSRTRTTPHRYNMATVTVINIDASHIGSKVLCEEKINRNAMESSLMILY